MEEMFYLISEKVDYAMCLCCQIGKNVNVAPLICFVDINR